MLRCERIYFTSQQKYFSRNNRIKRIDKHQNIRCVDINICTKSSKTALHLIHNIEWNAEKVFRLYLAGCAVYMCVCVKCYGGCSVMYDS